MMLDFEYTGRDTSIAEEIKRGLNIKVGDTDIANLACINQVFQFTPCILQRGFDKLELFFSVQKVQTSIGRDILSGQRNCESRCLD